MRVESFSDDFCQVESDAFADLYQVLEQQEVFLREKSRIRWLVDGIKMPTSFILCFKQRGICLIPPCKLLVILSMTLIGLMNMLFPIISTFLGSE